MCLSTVFMEADGRMTKIVEDVARLETRDGGYLFVNLFGQETFVRGRLVRIDFVDENAIELQSP